MAKSFLVCKANRFNKENFIIPIQQKLFEDEGTSEVKIEMHKPNFYLGFDQFMCTYDYMHKKSGRVFNRNFNYYFEPLRFYAYFLEELNLVLVQTKGDAAIDFINKLNSTKSYDIQPVDMHFNKMIPLITEVAGAWIANLNRAHLKTAGLFGPNVHKSEEYIEAASEGNVSAIQMKYILDKSKVEYYVMISKKGSIVLYDTFDTIESEIELVYDVFSKIINPHL